ncbi:hypothetical protein D2T29_16010 [Sinirhodobacter populi]|uniref:Uncharacterized protein n=1 Tax=Paenirhodobacter populi TaxID=2306993 RepID=A0A443J1H1_9RHOB|nr:hypothetical protein [Sinirhodobacter populi]RWR14225.1 hypothetical protein D2T33_03125 [Sinirhodobacter populi]RWR28732.1 hypothetical protein D2T29_16010 [Sinirhodobacter populi]
MLLEPFNTPPRRLSEAERLNAACKVAAQLDGLPACDLVSAFLAATLGDVRASSTRFEAQGYGFCATSIRNRSQAVRNWIVLVTTRAAMAPVGRVA